MGHHLNTRLERPATDVPMPTSAIITLQDHEHAAQAVLNEAAWAYFSGGAVDEITLRRNVTVWQHLVVPPATAA